MLVLLVAQCNEDFFTSNKLIGDLILL